MDFTGLKMEFDGERVYLKTLSLEHATKDYSNWLNDPEVNKFLATKSATIEELRSYITQKDNQKDALFFGIFIKENDKFIGTIKLEPINVENNKATIALMIGDKNYWGKGIAGEAIKLLIDYSFNELDLEEINLGVIGENKAAIRAYEKLGFKETKREPKAVKYDDILYDQVTMALKKSN
jgi:RimJ/RimL family protein N-acetyltransferase